MKGIYKIESPNGKVYIGQSIDIKRRFKSYRYVRQSSCQKSLYHSFLKHGFLNHSFSILHELPADIPSDIMTSYEQFYIDRYKEAGFEMMNINKAATRGPHSIETKKIIGMVHSKKIISDAQRKNHSEKMKGRVSPRKGSKLTQQQKEHLRVINTGKRLSDECIMKLKNRAVWNKGLTGIGGGPKGQVRSQEYREKIRQSLLGKKLSPETIQKRTESLRANKRKKEVMDGI